MKKLISIILLFISVGIFTSCEDMLKEEQKGVYSEDTFFQTKENAISAIMSVYYPIQSGEIGERFQFSMMDLPTDQYSNYGRGTESPFYKLDVSPITEEFNYNFKALYLCIDRANSVIENVGKMSTTAISQADKDQIVGEAYFLRAYCHFMAVRTWGKIPIHDSSINSPTQGRNTYPSIQDAYKFIISDLEKATSMMVVQRVLGRGDLVAAQALISKVYLTMASSKMTGAPGYEWVSDAEASYVKAAEYASKVMNGQSTYALETNISKVFGVNNENSPENIWLSHHSRQYNRANFPMMFAANVTGKYISKVLGANVTDASQVEPYINPGQGGWNYYTPSGEFYNTYDNLDLRKQFMCTKIYNKNGSVKVTWAPDNVTSTDGAKNAFYFPMCVKYTDPESPDINTTAELHYMRFAEVMLTYAEAVGPTAQGYAAINAVRSRAGLPALTAGLSITDFRKKAWDEVYKELAFEGVGLLELRRTKRVLEKITKPEIRQDVLAKYAYFYPIPQREADLNPQN